MKHSIKKISALQILDSRGNPTLQVKVETDGGIVGVAGVPSGASTGKYEAVELRDGGGDYDGKSVCRAVENVGGAISSALVGKSVFAQGEIDRTMIELDGTSNKENLGGNAILAVSLACARAGAAAKEMPLFRYVGGVSSSVMPVPMMNILNGGAHASNGLDFQEFMILPTGAHTFSQALHMGTRVYHALKKQLQQKGLSDAVGDEGGFAPEISDEREALLLLCDATEAAGYRIGEDICFALDVAASEWTEDDHYRLPKKNSVVYKDELIERYRRLVSEFPIVSIEDPLGEEDFDGFRQVTHHFAGKVQIVGDDLFVTNPSRLVSGIMAGAANAVLIKPNQVGTLSETMETVRLAKRHGYRTIMSHRSGETEDTTIADLAVALNCGQIKTGAPARGERVGKYNRLLRIEQMLGENARYLGGTVYGR
ncbi:MAG: phosphopyruvate hydratase [Clostridia bacterium]|nr:phosphopyruvate hydratase [Clostridia bacterium]